MDNFNSFSLVKLDGMDNWSTRRPLCAADTLFGDNTELMESYFKPRQCWVIGVEGYNTSLPADEIKKALTDHFRSCGAIAKVEIPVDRPASVIIIGDDANEKALELNGSELGGRKLVVTAMVYPMLVKRDAPSGSTVPATQISEE
ncbi:RNA-binding domain superfamily [Arabidopsis thaliana x Arabidopsis arenosa]|uniref:RNA-binding domain superfamily n=1 Tax=Arabidopsis thaliana x Arabidopsis arenosa TaxID=1240361 RepID=A0A8T1YBX8_9BRAS|nr:RNA-binding domain superfamily [Arabidopsis thaliana x Arabidopsis arenosa]